MVFVIILRFVIFNQLWSLGYYSLGGLVLLLGRLLLDDLHHLLLDLLLFQHEPVLIPDEVGGLQIESMALHARLEKVNNVGIIGVLGEGKTAAVVHKLTELLRLVLAEFFDGHFLLLLLDVGIFFLLGSARESLPWQRSLQEVEKHMTDSLKIVSSRLLVPNVRVNGGVSGGTSQVLAVSEGNMLTI